MDFYQIAASVAGLLVVVAGLPQIFRMIKPKHSGDVSIPMFILFFCAQVIWLGYGIHLNDMAIIVSNVGALIVTTINLYLIRKYRNGQATS